MSKIVNNDLMIELQASFGLYCDTCGYPMTAEVQSDDVKSLISIFPCENCIHRRAVSDYRRGWEDYKKFGESVVSKAQERRLMEQKGGGK